MIYSLATQKYPRLYDSHSALSPIWLNDGRRVLFLEGSRVMLIDRGARATRELLSVAPDTMDLGGRSRATTGRSISFGGSSRRTSG